MQVEVLNRQNFKKKVEFKSNKPKCILELDEKVFIGCWNSVLEIYLKKGQPLAKLITASDIRCFLVQKSVKIKPRSLFEDSPKHNDLLDKVVLCG
jgi:hypothetical protein